MFFVYPLFPLPPSHFSHSHLEFDIHIYNYSSLEISYSLVRLRSLNMLPTILTVACTLLFLTADAAKIPKEWKLCKHDANLSKCLKASLEAAIPQFVKGVPSLGIYSIDPLHFDKLIIGKGNGPVSLDLSFHNFDVIGIKNLKFNTFETDWKTMKAKVAIPKVVIKGGYKVNGKVLVLPVTGDGDCLLELIDLTADAVIHISTITKDNKKYYKIDKIDLPLAINKLTLKMNNLFNGDKKLGDQMNIFLNENWQEIFKELQPAISEAVSTAFTEIGNRVFSKISKDQITPP